MSVLVLVGVIVSVGGVVSLGAWVSDTVGNDVVAGAQDAIRNMAVSNNEVRIFTNFSQWY